MSVVVIVTDLSPICPEPGIWYCDGAVIGLPLSTHARLLEVGGRIRAIGAFEGRYASLRPAYIIAKVKGKDEVARVVRVEITFVGKMNISSAEFLDELRRFLSEVKRREEAGAKVVLLSEREEALFFDRLRRKYGLRRPPAEWA